MMLRRCRRAVALTFSVLGSVFEAWTNSLRRPLTPTEQALWLQSAARKVLAAAGIDLRVVGVPPGRGLVVSNHLSYLDVAAFAAVMPCAMVSKIEVSRWPVFGVAARQGGTIFIDRSSRESSEAVALEIAGRLSRPVPILVFPEGTSSDGTEVLRFHSRLFEPAAVTEAPITAAAIGYEAADGTPEPALCWFGDQAFLPHLWRVLGHEKLCIQVQFGESRIYPDRRTAAWEAQAEVETMRASGNAGQIRATERAALTHS